MSYIKTIQHTIFSEYLIMFNSCFYKVDFFKTSHMTLHLLIRVTSSTDKNESITKYLGWNGFFFYSPKIFIPILDKTYVEWSNSVCACVLAKHTTIEVLTESNWFSFHFSLPLLTGTFVLYNYMYTNRLFLVDCHVI